MQSNFNDLYILRGGVLNHWGKQTVWSLFTGKLSLEKFIYRIYELFMHKILLCLSSDSNQCIFLFAVTDK